MSRVFQNIVRNIGITEQKGLKIDFLKGIFAQSSYTISVPVSWANMIK